jgi:hypothetical protein
MKKNKVAIAALAAALSFGSITAASADTGHAVGVPPQVSTVLSSLVAKGTITQAQADAITAALTAAAPTAPSLGKPTVGGMGGKGPKGEMGGKGGFGMNTAARQAIITSTLGITAADLQAARVAGKSLATLAGTKTDALITALVNYDTTQIDAAVAANTLTAAQATTLKAGLKTRITAEVNNVGGKGHGPDGDNDHAMGGAAPKIPGSTGSTGTTTKSSVKKATITTVKKSA